MKFARELAKPPVLLYTLKASGLKTDAPQIDLSPHENAWRRFECDPLWIAGTTTITFLLYAVRTSSSLDLGDKYGLSVVYQQRQKLVASALNARATLAKPFLVYGNSRLDLSLLAYQDRQHHSLVHPELSAVQCEIFGFEIARRMIPQLLATARGLIATDGEPS